jgi:hypothetical protein
MRINRLIFHLPYSIFHFPFSGNHRLLVRAVLSDDVKSRQSSLFSSMIPASSSDFSISLRSIMRSQINVSFSSFKTIPSLWTNQHDFPPLALHRSWAREKFLTSESAQRRAFPPAFSANWPRADDADGKVNKAFFEFVGFDLRASCDWLIFHSSYCSRISLSIGCRSIFFDDK